MASKKEVIEKIQQVKSWYGDKCPPEVLAELLKVDVSLAEVFIKEYGDLPEKKKRVVKKKEEPSKPVEKFDNIAKKVLPFGALVIAIIALARSILFTYSYFNRTENVVVAIAMAVLFGLVGYLSPSIAILAFKVKKWAMLVLASIIFIIFSYMNVYITISEMDRTYQETEMVVVEGNEEVLKARNEVARLEVLIKDSKETIKRLEAEYAIVLANSAKEGIQTWEYNRHRNNLSSISSKIEQEENLVKKYNNSISELTKVEGYYTMEVLTKADKESERGIHAVYGIVLEVVGPVFMVFSLFL